MSLLLTLQQHSQMFSVRSILLVPYKSQAMIACHLQLTLGDYQIHFVHKIKHVLYPDTDFLFLCVSHSVGYDLSHIILICPFQVSLFSTTCRLYDDQSPTGLMISHLGMTHDWLSVSISTLYSGVCSVR